MFGKRGKYEAVPTEAAVKYQKKSAKSNLLTTYFTSLLCLILCATMFLSTSMAWFTSEVNNAGNQIYVGTLGVKLYNGGNEVKDGSAPILDNVKMSPDTHHIVNLRVENTGNLPFNYRLTMTANYEDLLADPATVADASKALEAAEWITVWVNTEGKDFNRATVQADGWVQVGGETATLLDVLAGKVVLSGKMGDEGDPGYVDYRVALHMDANAPSSIMGAKLTDISVKLIAAQQVAGLTVVADAEELSKAMAQGGNVLLLNDIDVDADSTIKIANGTTTNLYMNGHVISGVSDQTGSNRNLIDVRGTLTVYDGTIALNHTGDNMGWNNSTNVIHIEGGGIVNLKNTKIVNLGGSDMAIGIHMNNWGEVTLNADNSEIISTYCAVRLFNSGNDKNNVTITNSKIMAGSRALWVHNYTLADFGNDQTKADAAKARLNINVLVEKPDATNTLNNVKNLNAEANNEIVGSISFGYTNRVVYYTTSSAVVASIEDLENAVENAENGDLIVLAADITGDVTVTQKADISITIDGNGHKFNGVMTVFGNGRQSGKETLTIKNVNFVAANGAGSCIVSPDRTVNNLYSYSHNVTIENCTFTDPDGDVNCAAIRQEDGGDKNWIVKNCTVDNTMHSLFQVNNVEGKLTVEGCKVYSKNGANLNSCTNVEMTNCTFDVKGYAVRFGVSSGGNLGTAKTYVIKDSTLKSACNDGDAVIMFRASAVDAKLTLTNTTITGNTEISGNTDATTITKN